MQTGLACLMLGLAVAPPRLGADATINPSEDIDIGVRSTVDERWEGVHKHGAIEHGKVYGIASIKEVPAVSNLVQPVNEAMLLQHLREELNRRGFSEMSESQKPDIVLTVLYGRGWLRNPYLKGMILNEESEMVPVASSITPDVAFRLREPGFEAKLQAAQHEKLFIRVSAWKYPSQPGEKPSEYWKTTMVVDDPDHRDLNRVMKSMLVAGAEYFDRIIRDEEVRINSATPKGRVILGPTKVIESDPKQR